MDIALKPVLKARFLSHPGENHPAESTGTDVACLDMGSAAIGAIGKWHISQTGRLRSVMYLFMYL